MSALSPGDRVAGKYVVERVLGAGGMGVVLVALHEELRHRVAIKLLARQADDDACRRFLREARAAAQLGGEHVVRVHDVGALPDGQPYMVMELLEGEDLGVRLARKGVLPVAEAIELTLQAAHAIAGAHARGIVHRDIKPANLFVTIGRNGAPLLKVLDFGISKMNPLGEEGGAATSTDVTMGSPRYMPPEQMQSSRLTDARSDVWSLGVTLFELLTGRVPFEGQTPGQVFARVLQEPPLPLTILRPEVSPAVQVVVERALEKRPEARYADAAAFAAALSAARDDAQSLGRVVISVPPPGAKESSAEEITGTDPTLAASSSVKFRPARSSRAWAPAALAIGLALIGWGAWTATRPASPRSLSASAAGPAQPVASPAAGSVGSSPAASASTLTAATSDVAPSVVAPSVVAPSSSTSSGTPVHPSAKPSPVPRPPSSAKPFDPLEDR